MDLKAASTIQLCLADEVMYNMMDEEAITIVVKVRNAVYDEKSLQQAVSQETTIWAMHEGRDSSIEVSKLLQ